MDFVCLMIFQVALFGLGVMVGSSQWGGKKREYERTSHDD